MIMEYRSGVIHQSFMEPRYYLMVRDSNLVVSSGKRFDDMTKSSDWDDIIDVSVLSGYLSSKYWDLLDGSIYYELNFPSRSSTTISS